MYRYDDLLIFQEEELSVVRGTVSQAEASMRENSELDLELSDQIVQNEVNVELQQVEKDHPAVQMLEMASVPVESDKVVEAEEQAPSIDVGIFYWFDIPGADYTNVADTSRGT